MENLGSWAVICGAAYLILYVLPMTVEIVQSSKFNPAYPSARLVLKEALRSARGVILCTAYDVLVNEGTRRGQLPMFRWSVLSENVATVTATEVIVVGVALYLWGDFHFYWSHRSLHQPTLFRWVHKVHHESYNPDPLSGLSMHPIESLVYFSSCVLLAPVVPLWVFRVFKVSLILAPINGHAGHGSWEDLAGTHHYIHHAKFNWNYGSSPLWDRLCGTVFDEARLSQVKEKAQLQAALAMEQARLCGAVVVDGKRSAPKETTEGAAADHSKADSAPHGHYNLRTRNRH